ncbi:uncharacterized protein RHO25_011288 [Cercospora beticola]|uniref:Uncharacterized protein n=1 Tax=Cercospora beticola TaxID=122368 RepID=A0ABZ0P4K1_CERBT|nr:hypothetical protein RHO25_011288 [Cercospora beticola]
MSRRLILRWTWLARYGIQGDPDPHCERLRPGLVGQLPKPSTDAFRKSIKLFRDRYNSKIAKFRESNPATPLRDVQDEGWLYVRPFSRDKGVGSVKTLNENLHTRGAVVEDDSDDDEARYWRHARRQAYELKTSVTFQNWDAFRRVALVIYTWLQQTTCEDARSNDNDR